MFIKIKASTEPLEKPRYIESYINTDYIILITQSRRCVLCEVGDSNQVLYLDEESFENLINIINGKQGTLEKWRNINNG